MTEHSTETFPWGPTIDAELCDGCRTCADFCHKGVFEERDGKVCVVVKTNCVPGCSHCSTLCPQGAITFPSVEELKRWRAAAKKAAGPAEA